MERPTIDAPSFATDRGPDARCKSADLEKLEEAEARRAVAGVRQHDRLAAKAFAYRQHHPLAISVAVALDKIVTDDGVRLRCAVVAVVEALVPRIDMLLEIVGHTPRADTSGGANRRDCWLDQSREDRLAAPEPTFIIARVDDRRARPVRWYRIELRLKPRQSQRPE